jgi:WD40 repeat protein
VENAALAKPLVWTVAVDPSTLAPAELKPRDVRIPLSTSVQEVVFGEHGSTFFALRGGQAIEVWDAAKEKKLATVGTGSVVIHKMSLSADAAYVAAAALSGGDSGVVVWDVKGEKALGQLSLPQRFPPSVLLFGGSQRLLAEQQRQVHVWKLPSGDLERTVELPNSAQTDCLAVSPGGNYLAVCADGERTPQQRERHTHLVVYDLRTGAVAGEAVVASQEQSFSAPRCQALSFSADGEQLAGVFEESSKGTLVLWNVAMGEAVKQHKYTQSLRQTIPGAFSYRGPAVEWFPDRKHLLVYGHGVVSAEQGSLVQNFPESFRGARHVLPDGRLANANTSGRDAALVSLKLSDSALAQAQAAIDAGGRAEDAGLPPLTAADVSGLENIPLAESGGAWRVTADPAPAPPEKLLSKPLQLKTTTARMERMLLSDAVGARAVIMNIPPAPNTRPLPGRPSSSSSAAGKREAPVWLDVYDLQTTRQQKPVDISVPSDLLAVSPDGKFSLMRLQPAQDRLDLWSLEGGGHVVGWRPYPPQEDGDQGRIVLSNSRSTPTQQRADAAVFLDNEYLLTLSGNKRIVLWKLPECRAVYAIDNAGTPGISPGHKYLVVANGNSFRFFNARTGEAVGDLPSAGTLNAAAFHPDGKRFAVSFTGRYGASLLCWDLDEGTIQKEFPLPIFGRHMHWCGDRYLLMDGKSLIDVERGMIVWKYQIATGIQSPITPDDRHWFLGKKLPQSPAIYLAAAALPDRTAVASIAAANPQPRYLVEPGGRLSLQLQLLTPPGRPNFAEEAREQIVAKLGANGITVADGQPVTALVVMAQGNTGQTNQYSSTFGFGRSAGGPTQSVTERYVDCVVSFQHQGKAIWEEKRRFLNDGYYVRLQEGESLDQKLDASMWENAASYVLNVSPPAYVFPEGAADGLGTTVLTPDTADSSRAAR